MRTIIFLLFLLPQLAFAQSGIKGFVKNKDGALPFATIFIKELANGTSTNEDGYYEYKLQNGTYTVVYQYLGYVSVEKKITIDNKFVSQDVNLEQQTIVLKEIIVKSNKENPAYTIMRKAIAKSEYHLKQLKSYQARVYLKGAGQILDMPNLIKRQIDKAAKEDSGENFDLNQVFITESISELSFEMPDKYKEKVLSVKSSGNENNASPAGFIKSSFYSPIVNDVISPLSPSAFSYYRFTLEGTFRDQNIEINKIKVTPFSRGEDVFEGFIYIIEDLWCLHSVELKTKKMGFDIKIDEVFSPVGQNVWMPTNYKFFVKGGIIGIKMEYNYSAALSNYKIELNPKLIADINLVDEKVNAIKKAELPKDLADLEKKMGEGKEIRRKDLGKYMKNMEKEEEKQLLQKRKEQKLAAKNKNKKPNLADTLVTKDSTRTIEIGSRTYNGTVMEIDSMAYKRTDEFWNEFRPVPLSQKELVSYKKSDSLKVVNAEKKRIKDSIELVNPTKIENTKKHKNVVLGSLVDVLVGSTFRISKTSTIELLPMVRDASFNAVEGWAFNAGFTYSKSFLKKDSLEVVRNGKAKKYAQQILDFKFTPIIRYSFARETAIGQVNFQFDYKQSKSARTKNRLEFTAGRFIAQFNENNPIPTIVNTFYAYSLGKNYVKLYEKDFIKINSSHVWHKTLSNTFSVEFAERTMLDNNTNTTLTKRENFNFESNTPKNLETDSLDFQRHNAFIVGTKIKWNPLYGFRIGNEASEMPEITFDYRKGIKNVGGSNVDFDFVQLGLKHEIEIGIKRYFGFSLGAGAFLNKNAVYFPDYAHFLGNQTILQTHDRYASFRILDYYTNSTADKFVRAHAHYQFRKLLLTQITPLRFMGWKERVFVNYLSTPKVSHYTEVGFGIDNLFRFFSVEGIVSFNGSEYQNWGIRIGISGMKNMAIFN